MDSMVIVADSSFVIETIRIGLRDSAGLKILAQLDGGASVRGRRTRMREERG
jgi:hypothetical protein